MVTELRWKDFVKKNGLDRDAGHPAVADHSACGSRVKFQLSFTVQDFQVCMFRPSMALEFEVWPLPV